MNHHIELNQKLYLKDLGLYFHFFAIAPEGSKYGAWPYCLEYQYKGLDYFGLGDYGSNYRIENPKDVNHALMILVDELSPKSFKAIQVAKLGSRKFELGHKYHVKFQRPGLFHKGTFFESFRDIEEYIKLSQYYTKDLLTESVVSLVGGGSLGKYHWRNGYLSFERRIENYDKDAQGACQPY